MDQIQQLSDYIDQSHSIVAITGAGISLAGGGITYGQLFSKTVLHGILGRDRFLRSYVKAMHSYKPTFSHYALRDLEAAGKLIGTNGYYGGAYWDYRRRDAVIVQINPGHTSFDQVADLNIREACDDVFHKLTERWNGNG